MKPMSKYYNKMTFYLLFIVFLYVGGCNARVVPLNFKVDTSGVTENELIDESPMDEVEILGHNLPDSRQGEDLELFKSEENNTTVLEVSNHNTSNLPVDLAPKENALDEESNLEIAESSALSSLLEEINSTSEFRSQNNSDSRDSFETIQVNGTLNNKDEGLKNKTTITNNSSSFDLEQRNLVFSKTEKVVNDTLDQNETSEVFNSDQNRTFASFDVNSDQNETSVPLEVDGDQNETFAPFEVESDQNETFASFEVVDSDHNETFEFFEVDSDQNETFVIFKVVNGTNNTNDFFELHPLSNDTKVEFLTDGEDNTEKFKSSNLTSENLELTNDSAKTAGGIFSGFEFLINSEVARNAAKAMEVFNFSDPLTDHIMEENEFHSFLNAEQDLDSPNQTDLKSAAIITSSSGESNEIRADFNKTLPSGEETSIVLNQVEPEETEKDSMPFNLSKPLEERNKTVQDLEEKSKGNVTSEGSSPLEKSEEKIISSEATTLNENIKGSSSNSSAVGEPKCPPAGWCIFWFLSQDACAVNDHCLGNRICCKIGCSNTCIEVESL